MDKLSATDELLANFAEAIYKDIENYINEHENSKKDIVEHEIQDKRFKNSGIK